MSSDNGHPKAQWMDITPDQAKRWLEEAGLMHANFRRQNDQHIMSMAEAMKGGKFECNGETVKFDKRGVLIDGQHRLTACVISNTPFTTLVVFGVDSDYEIDRGKPRTLKQELRRKGEMSASALASALRMVASHEQYGISNDSSRTPAFTSTHDSLACLKRHGQIRESVKAHNRFDRNRLMPCGPFAAMHYLMGRIDKKVRDEMFEAVFHGENLKKSDPAYLLRNQLIADKATLNQRRMSSIYKCALLVKVWNAYRDGNSIRQLKWRQYGVGSESFPEINGDSLKGSRLRYRSVTALGRNLEQQRSEQEAQPFTK